MQMIHERLGRVAVNPRPVQPGLWDLGGYMGAGRSEIVDGFSPDKDFFSLGE